jgi:hypothetical protein
MCDLEHELLSASRPIERHMARSSLKRLRITSHRVSMRMPDRSSRVYAGHSGAPAAAGLPVRAKLAQSSAIVCDATKRSGLLPERKPGVLCGVSLLNLNVMSIACGVPNWRSSKSSEKALVSPRSQAKNVYSSSEDRHTCVSGAADFAVCHFNVDGLHGRRDAFLF